MIPMPDSAVAGNSRGGGALKAASSAARFVAGGTDLLVNLRRGLGAPTDLIDLSTVGNLNSVRRDGDAMWVGAAVTLANLARHPDVLSAYPALVEAALAVAGPTHRAAATLAAIYCRIHAACFL